jgi:hypothetical protein
MAEPPAFFFDALAPLVKRLEDSMRNFIELGASPSMMESARVASSSRSLHECRAYRQQIRRLLGPEPPGVQLVIEPTSRSLGSLYRVVCYYQTDDQGAVEYACRCNSQRPAYWDEAALVEMLTQ